MAEADKRYKAAALSAYEKYLELAHIEPRPGTLDQRYPGVDYP